jgi:hypothetical protein
MATTCITFGAPAVIENGVVDGLDNQARVSETITPTAGNQQTTATAPNVGRRPVAQVATDTAVYVAFGTNPNATTAGTRFMVPANQVVRVLVNAGDKAAVVTAP